MNIYAIGDLHLSGNPPTKPMNIFGPHWDNHWQRIKEHWLSTVTNEDIIFLVGDMSWALRLDEALYDPKWVPQLLAWYDVNKRDLPWRDCGDPYKVWVSEVMSQQTRIEAMKPYYDNWMRLFPTLEELAKASEDEVVHAWQGLGYYSRARNLRLGVQDVVNNYGGVVPHNRKEMESLKGVGSYTAGAVLSMA